MSFQFYCPSYFEVPKSLRSRTKIFGMGRSNAEKLGRELSSLPAEIQPVIFGCAGSLREDFKPGDVFVISKIGETTLPSQTKLPQAILISSPVILRTPTEKILARNLSSADLVDQEMEFIWKSASEEVRTRLIFIRGVIDGVNDDISFLGTGGVDWKQLVSPTKLLSFLKFIGNWKRYSKGVDHIFLRYFPPTS